MFEADELILKRCKKFCVNSHLGTERLRFGPGEKMTIDNELIDNVLKDYKKPEDIIGENGLLKQLTKRCWSGPWRQS
jgi:hypothetical protein